MEFIYFKQKQLPNDVSWIVSCQLQPCYPSYVIMRLTNILKDTTVRYRISATQQLKLHWIVGVPRVPYHLLHLKIFYLFPNLIPFSLAQSPELNGWGDCSRRPYNSILFNRCNLGSQIYSLHYNSGFIRMWITLMQRWVHTTLSFWCIFITIIQLTDSFWLSFLSLP